MVRRVSGLFSPRIKRHKPVPCFRIVSRSIHRDALRTCAARPNRENLCVCSPARCGERIERRRWRKKRGDFEEVPRLAGTTVPGNRLARRCYPGGSVGFFGTGKESGVSAAAVLILFAAAAGKSAKRRRWRKKRVDFEEVPRLAGTTVPGNRLARRCRGIGWHDGVTPAAQQDFSGQGKNQAFLPQQFLYFLPEPQGQGSLRPIFWTRRGCFFTVPSPPTLSPVALATRSRLIS